MDFLGRKASQKIHKVYFLSSSRWGLSNGSIIASGRSISRIITPRWGLFGGSIIASGRSVSRILSGRKVYQNGTVSAWVSISLDRTLPCSSSSLPGTYLFRRRKRAASRSQKCELYLCLTLLRMGVAWPPILLPAPVVSYTAFSPLSVRWYYFCSPIQRDSAFRALPGILLYGVRTFLDSTNARSRPPDQPEAIT